MGNSIIKVALRNFLKYITRILFLGWTWQMINKDIISAKERLSTPFRWRMHILRRKLIACLYLKA